MTGPTKRLLAVGLWISALGLLGFAIYRTVGAPETQAALPELGSSVSVDSINDAFGSDLVSQRPGLILVLTSSCPACLGLRAELQEMQKAAGCRGTILTPLVIELEQSLDSIRSVLEAQALEIGGSSPPAGFDVLGVRAVPSLLGFDSRGLVDLALTPNMDGWPGPSC